MPANLFIIGFGYLAFFIQPTSECQIIDIAVFGSPAPNHRHVTGDSFYLGFCDLKELRNTPCGFARLVNDHFRLLVQSLNMADLDPILFGDNSSIG